MELFLPILEALAEEYKHRYAGRTGRGTRDVQIEFEVLLKLAHCDEGDRRELADRQLRALNGTLIELEFAHHRDRSNIFKVRLPPGKEEEFFAHIGRTSPNEGRNKLASQFHNAANNANVPEPWCVPWRNFCKSYATAAS